MTRMLFYYFEFGGISFRGAEGNGYMELCYENIIMVWFSLIEKFLNANIANDKEMICRSLFKLSSRFTWHIPCTTIVWVTYEIQIDIFF